MTGQAGSSRTLRRTRVTAQGENRSDQTHLICALETNQTIPYVSLNIHHLHLHDTSTFLLHAAGCRRLARVLQWYARLIDEFVSEGGDDA